MAAVVRAQVFIGGTLLLFVIALTACGAPASGNPEEGKKWYTMNNCNACHGLHGNDGRSPSIAGISMSFGSFVKKLRKSDAPIMPPFPVSKISDQDAADIYAYLKTLK